MRIKLDGIEFTLREPHDFAWLGGLGTVFSVYDRQDSGNLLFGVERDGRRRFVKYAGARTLEHEGTPQEAIERLRRAAGVYRAISHPHLISLEEEIECPQGFAAVFPWFEGRGLHEHWTFDRVAKLASGSPYRRYLHLPMEKRLRSLEAVFAFLEYVESIGYVAVDFYDGSIMYDFERDITKICDIDFFTKAPAVNRLGAGYWGTKRLKAPEEYMTGAVIDTVPTSLPWAPSSSTCSGRTPGTRSSGCPGRTPSSPARPTAGPWAGGNTKRHAGPPGPTGRSATGPCGSSTPHGRRPAKAIKAKKRTALVGIIHAAVLFAVVFFGVLRPAGHGIQRTPGSAAGLHQLQAGLFAHFFNWHIVVHLITSIILVFLFAIVYHRSFPLSIREFLWYDNGYSIG